MKNNEREIQELADTTRKGNIRIMGILEGEEKEQGLESIFRQIVDKNFPNLRNELELGIQGVNRTPNYLNPRRPLRHIVLKLSKNKDRILRAATEKTVTYKGKPIRLLSDFSSKTLQARKEWNQIVKLLIERNYQPRIMYPAKRSFRYDEEIKTFPDTHIHKCTSIKVNPFLLPQAVTRHS
uniref:L1 transposable element RRM domain-containing protein n=1 Tax=Rousettus aegyptiacus TaxID=9407 RepID=A0A7J8DIL6_ROUAE|nr:hypothetical protein HJG63_008664 [Rousettus aegyptiacus]